jgi:hypothetical protein
MTISKYFSSPSPTPPHPRIKFWQKLLEQAPGTKMSLVFDRLRNGLLRGQPRLFVTFAPPTGLPRLDECDWEQELDDWLIERGVRGDSQDNDQERLGLHLARAFRPIIDRYGPSYFDAVLVDFLAKGDFSQSEVVAEMLGQIHRRPPVSGPVTECTAFIEAEISKLAGKIGKLYEDEEAAVEVLAGAVASYLDERFSISNQKMLGWG